MDGVCARKRKGNDLATATKSAAEHSETEQSKSSIKKKRRKSKTSKESISSSIFEDKFIVKNNEDQLSDCRVVQQHPNGNSRELTTEPSTTKTIAIPHHLTPKEAKKFRKDERRKARLEGISEDRIIFIVEEQSSNKEVMVRDEEVGITINNLHHHLRPAFSFVVDDTDHCETPASAYSDLLPLLDACCRIFGKNRRALRIYDPYYCNGAVIRHLGNIGFMDVYNQCEDFYSVQAADKIPQYDVLVTNPPYSGEHIEKLLSFCTSSGKPWFCLLPHWVYTKSYYNRHGLRDVWYLVKHTIRYAYEPPKWVNAGNGSTAIDKGRQRTAPFPSFWYCWYPQVQREQVLEGIENSSSTTTMSSSCTPPFIVRNRQFEMMRHPLLLCLDVHLLPYEVRGELDNTRKRPNAKARKRMKKKIGQW
jgi:hypothetical protein